MAGLPHSNVADDQMASTKPIISDVGFSIVADPHEAVAE
jgi:hypothetical protein